MVTVAGTATVLARELVRAITLPPVGAGPERVTVPLTEVVELPFTEVGDTEMESRVGALIDRLALAELDPRVAVMGAVLVAFTAVVVIVNLALIEPIGTLTVPGKVIPLLVVVSFTTTVPAPVPGAALRLTSPVELEPPTTLAGERVNVATANGLRVSVAV